MVGIVTAISTSHDDQHCIYFVQGNCCGSESQEVENHPIKPIKNKAKAGAAGQTLGGGTTSASPSNIDSEGSREAMLSAAEKRRLQVRFLFFGLLFTLKNSRLKIEA